MSTTAAAGVIGGEALSTVLARRADRMKGSNGCRVDLAAVTVDDGP